jgi:enoyl-CoA hydratase/carnithine racemase
MGYRPKFAGDAQMKTAFGESVRVERVGHVAIVTLERPPHNYVSLAFITAIADALEAIDVDRQIRATVLQAEGKSFCAGADFHDVRDRVVDEKTGLPSIYVQGLRLFALRKPIVAAIQGPAVGAGLGLALVADFRLVSPEARFVGNFTRLGFHAGFGITLTLPRLIGQQKAALMLLTGRRIKAEHALAWGLADELVPDGDLRAAALALANEIAECAPLGTIATRQTLRADLVEAIRGRTIAEYLVQEGLRQTEDFAEGIKAVAERRLGKFVGR